METIEDIQKELQEVKEFLDNNNNKAYTTDTVIIHYGTPIPISQEEGMLFLKRAFESIRNETGLHRSRNQIKDC